MPDKGPGSKAGGKKPKGGAKPGGQEEEVALRPTPRRVRLDDAPYVHAADRAAWRASLEAHHATVAGAWLVTWKPRTVRGTLDYEAAVEEALCFGWVDGAGEQPR